MKRLGIVSALALAVACGGGGTSPASTVSTTPTTPTAPTTPTNTWSVAGQVVTSGSGQPVGGATITPGWSLDAVTADAQGNFQLGAVANPPTTPYPVSVSSAGMISHDVWINWARGPRSGVTIDLIRDAAPFSMDFYKQMVRGTYDRTDGPWPVLRLNAQPHFYVKTVDQEGKPFDTYVIPGVIDAINRAVPAFTGGRFSAVIDTGTDTRPPSAGWIVVDIQHNPTEKELCGHATIGADAGTITLTEDVCGCTKVAGAVVMHEVGHALGFFHVADTNSIMYPFIGGPCPRAGALSAAELFHANLAYSRPRGNTDPDKDPGDSASALALKQPPVAIDRR
jgi:Matrixin